MRRVKRAVMRKQTCETDQYDHGFTWRLTRRFFCPDRQVLEVEVEDEVLVGAVGEEDEDTDGGAGDDSAFAAGAAANVARGGPGNVYGTP